ncbi:hypothetical protein ACIO6U_03865 [Streptomyces sp. NPDC087422]|uniref:hypothetical protein n=1 Tax=Streptomyces sp. NPDC087422 TaxID=3365786 RepID=UPI0037F7FA48
MADNADRFIAALPGAGWTLPWADGEVDTVVGFAVQDDGYALPILARSGRHGTPYYAEDGNPVATLRPPRERP